MRLVFVVCLLLGVAAVLASTTARAVIVVCILLLLDLSLLRLAGRGSRTEERRR